MKIGGGNPRKKKQHQVLLRKLEFCIISAQDLSAPTFGKMKCYAVAFIHPDHKVQTRVDREGARNPSWQAKFALEVDERLLSEHTQLTINIFNRGRLRDKLVGSVRVLLHDLIKDDHNSRNRFPVASYLVFRPDGDPQGLLNLCIPPGGRFPERFDSFSFKKEDVSLSIEQLAIPQDEEDCLSSSATELTGDSSTISEVSSGEIIENEKCFNLEPSHL